MLSISTFSKTKFENKLKYENSPYLKQHAKNPVWWYPWGKEAFERAKKENKIIFLSIGYSTCHWCHVMEKESFENNAVAKVLNDNFIAIKIDREERPDIDKIYMNSLHIMGQNGGWPLSMFLTPNLKPFTGGTYFPKDKFINLMGKISSEWKKNPKTFNELSTKIASYLKTEEIRNRGKINSNPLKTFLKQSEGRFDKEFGGFGSAPKFPSIMRLRLLMRIANRTKNQKKKKSIIRMVDTSLIAMFRGGIYDHIGGGFSRYSTDKYWLTPHFEKMLYDNASLAITYFEAYQLTHNKLFKNIGSDILDYVLREMTSTEGGFYSSQDADSEGHEGKFYVWAEKELKKITNEDEFKKLKSFYSFTQAGNFEHNTNILNLIDSKNENLVFNKKHKVLREKLYKYRKKRIPPLKDTKNLTSWNGLMISAMSLGYQVTKNQKYVDAAINVVKFINTKLVKKGQLYHRYINEETKYLANRNDYAYLIEGLLHLYESTFDEQFYSMALQYQDSQNKLWNKKQNGFDFSFKNKYKLETNMEFNDNARPNSNAVSVLNLLRLYHLSYENKYMTKAKSMLAGNMTAISRSPSAYGQLLIALDYYLDNTKEIAFVGQQKEGFLNHIYNNFYPNKVLSYKENGQKTVIPLVKEKISIDKVFTAYVCQNRVCLRPTEDLNIFKKQVNDKKVFK